MLTMVLFGGKRMTQTCYVVAWRSCPALQALGLAAEQELDAADLDDHWDRCNREEGRRT